LAKATKSAIRVGGEVERSGTAVAAGEESGGMEHF
jgi:hypothetical protein